MKSLMKVDKARCIRITACMSMKSLTFSTEKGVNLSLSFVIHSTVALLAKIIIQCP